MHALSTAPPLPHRYEPLDAGLSSRPRLASSASVDETELARVEAYLELEQLCRRCGCSSRLARELVRLHEMALAHAASTATKICGYELSVRNLQKAALMAARGTPIASVIAHTYDTMGPTLTQSSWEQALFGDAPSQALFGDAPSQALFGDAPSKENVPRAKQLGRGGDGDDDSEAGDEGGATDAPTGAGGGADGKADGGEGEGEADGGEGGGSSPEAAATRPRQAAQGKTMREEDNDNDDDNDNDKGKGRDKLKHKHEDEDKQKDEDEDKHTKTQTQTQTQA